MEYKTHFKLLLDYDLWANNIIAGSIKENNLISGKPIALYSHILNAEVICFDRVNNISSIQFDPFIVRGVEENIELSNSMYSKWKEYLNLLEENGFNNLLEYFNIRGEHITAKIWELFMHMINHSTYHRGQIATAIRNLDITPPVTDFITYARSIK